MPLPRNSRKPPRKPKPDPPSDGHKPLLSIPREIQLRESYFYLDDFEEGRRSGGVRAWEASHEGIMRRFYSTGPLVSPKRPHEHQDQLDEIGFASRARGRRAVSGTASVLSRWFGGKTFEERYLKPFASMGVKEREEVVLKAVADEVRSWDGSLADTTLKEWRRKLVPEMRLDELCADGGLRRLIERLVDHFDRFGLDDIPPFPHPDFDRKFGLDTPAHLPLSKASRAFQEEHVLVRHSTLFSFVEAILYTIVGVPIPQKGSVGNFAPEMTSENAPSIVSEGSSAAEAKKQVLATMEGVCSFCHESAEASGVKDLKKCARCLAVGRIELYCSAKCQKLCWAEHKKTCGKKASEAFSVPFFNTAPSPASALRKFVLRELDCNRDEYWVVKYDQEAPKIGSQRQFYSIGFSDSRDVPKTERIRTAMRSTAYKALRESDSVSIDVLACCVVPYVLTIDFDPYDVDEDDFNVGCPSNGEDADPSTRPLACKAKSAALIRQQFKEIFDLDDEQLDEATRRGEAELTKPGREGECEIWQHKELEARRFHAQTMNDNIDTLHGKDSPLGEMMRDLSALIRPKPASTEPPSGAPNTTERPDDS
ncbi:hypothetical protein JCM6882_005793 [Rhodosporidiobolus microsporus]